MVARLAAIHPLNARFAFVVRKTRHVEAWGILVQSSLSIPQLGRTVKMSEVRSSFPQATQWQLWKAALQGGDDTLRYRAVSSQNLGENESPEV